VVSDYWVDHCEYILLIDLRIVLLRAVFRSVLVLHCKFSNWKCWWTSDPAIIFDRRRGVGADCFRRNSRRSYRSGRALKYRARSPLIQFRSILPRVQAQHDLCEVLIDLRFPPDAVSRADCISQLLADRIPWIYKSDPIEGKATHTKRSYVYSCGDGACLPSGDRESSTGSDRPGTIDRASAWQFFHSGPAHLSLEQGGTPKSGSRC
jgi:hypothetical protein